MYRGFNLKIENSYKIGSFHKVGLELHKKLVDSVQPKLKNYILPEGTLDGNKIIEDWFPEVKSHIFLSHSHKDMEDAIYLAGILYHRFKILTFIDSTVWGYSNDLLKIIDDIYCRSENGETYDYSKRNYSTSHVNLMLSSALHNMIDKSEAIFFLNSTNSITSKGIVDKTNSPWIFSEINTSKTIRKQTPIRLRTKTKVFSEKVLMSESQNRQLNIEYELELSHLMVLNQFKLNSWLVSDNLTPETALDELYRQNPIESKFLII